MTPLYVKEFTQQNKCRACKLEEKSVVAKHRKMCHLHLRIARERFAQWSQDRRTAGKCISCNRKGHAGELRCKHHKKINQQRCKNWSDRIREKTVATGICHQCRRGNPVVGDTLRCAPCAKKEQAERRARKERLAAQQKG